MLLNRAKTKSQLAEVWNKYSGGQGLKRLDEVSICTTLKVCSPQSLPYVPLASLKIPAQAEKGDNSKSHRHGQ